MYLLINVDSGINLKIVNKKNTTARWIDFFVPSLMLTKPNLVHLLNM